MVTGGIVLIAEKYICDKCGKDMGAVADADLHCEIGWETFHSSDWWHVCESCHRSFAFASRRFCFAYFADSVVEYF